jgi:hypothetical protein
MGYDRFADICQRRQCDACGKRYKERCYHLPGVKIPAEPKPEHVFAIGNDGIEQSRNK